MTESSDGWPTLETVTLERDGHVLLIGLNRPEKRNAFNQAMLADLASAYGLLESDPSVRAGVLFAHGQHFTGGLDLVDVGPNIAIGLVQEIADDAFAALASARGIAQTIAGRAAPLAVQATLASAHLARERGDAAAIERLRPDVAGLFATADTAEGVQSFIERRQAQFQGR